MTKFRTLSLALTCLLAIGLASCAPTTSPDVIVTAPSTVTATLTSTPQPTSTPIPSPTLTFTPTAVKYSAEQLDNMTEEQKIAAAREMAGDVFGEKTIVGESVEGSVATFFSTYRTTDEYGKPVVRTYTVGGVELTTGEVIPGYTPKELVALHAEGAMPENFYFNGELVRMVVDTESALARAQEATYRGVEYPAEIPVWVDKDDNIVLVDWSAWPGGPRGLMSYSVSQDGRLVELLPVELELRMTLENLSAKEREDIFVRLMRDHRNADLEEVVNDPEGVVIAVTMLDSTTTTYWGGDESESPSTAMIHFVKQSNEETTGFTSDYRNIGVVVGFNIAPKRVIESWRTIATWDNGEWEAGNLAIILAVANQTTTSRINYDRNYWEPNMDLTRMLKDFGVQVVMFDTDKK